MFLIPAPTSVCSDDRVGATNILQIGMFPIASTMPPGDVSSDQSGSFPTSTFVTSKTSVARLSKAAILTLIMCSNLPGVATRICGITKTVGSKAADLEPLILLLSMCASSTSFTTGTAYPKVFPAAPNS
ncbi:hypothetical protein BPOR_0330g00090 [Botrytis porri]|uniref:Uncharacterized protein n=1 Tax=Botrytis porri TaxID=87229 RepID=A0A4Z1KJ92_9HELO|nr:hypothetical protein BPOR_0330g00090 [Botrytis porri]